MKKSFVLTSLVILSAALSSCNSPASRVDEPTITAVSTQASATSLRPGKSITISAGVSGKGAFSNELTWTVTPQVGTLVVSETTATYTAPSDFYGSVVITASSKQDATKTASVTLNIGAVAFSSLKGKITDWAKGASIIVGQVSDPSSTTGTSPYVDVVNAELTAQGEFDFTPPSEAVMSSYLNELGTPDVPTTCTSTLNFSDPTAKIGQLYSFSVRQNDSEITKVTAATNVSDPATNTSNFEEYTWSYSDRPVTITGKISCTDVSNGITSKRLETYNVHWARGWNAFHVKVSNTYDNATSTSTANVVVNDSTLDVLPFYDVNAAMASQSMKSQVRSFWNR